MPRSMLIADQSQNMTMTMTSIPLANPLYIRKQVNHVAEPIEAIFTV